MTIATTESTITEHEAAQVKRANASSATPVVFVHGLWLLPSSWDRWVTLFLADCSGARYSRPNSITGYAVRLVQSVRAAIRSCSRNHACAGSAVSRGCHTMKYEKPLISRGGSTTRTPGIEAELFANLRGSVSVRSVRAMAWIVGTKYGIRSAARRFRPSSARGRSTGVC